MAVELFIPKLGQTVEEVTLVNWLVEDGAKVSHGQEVMEVETDKAVFPVEANGKGYIHLGPYQAGQVLPVLTVVAIIGKESDTFAAASLRARGEAKTLPASPAGVGAAEAAGAAMMDASLPAAGAASTAAVSAAAVSAPAAGSLAAEKVSVSLPIMATTVSTGSTWPTL